MKIMVDQLSRTAQVMTDSPSQSWWEAHFGAREGGLEEGGFELAEGPVFEVSASCQGEKVSLSGKFQAGLDAQCGRCLRRYRHELQDSFELHLEPLGESVPPDPEGEEALEATGICLGEELETGWYRGNELELDEFLAELIALSWPLQSVCNQDCQGLCPQCGVNRSETSCECEMPKPESPFAVLEALRGKKTGSL